MVDVIRPSDNASRAFFESVRIWFDDSILGDSSNTLIDIEVDNEVCHS